LARCQLHSSELESDSSKQGTSHYSSEVMLVPLFDRPGCFKLAQVCYNFLNFRNKSLLSQWTFPNYSTLFPRMLDDATSKTHV